MSTGYGPANLLGGSSPIAIQPKSTVFIRSFFIGTIFLTITIFCVGSISCVIVMPVLVIPRSSPYPTRIIAAFSCRITPTTCIEFGRQPVSFCASPAHALKASHARGSLL